MFSSQSKFSGQIPTKEQNIQQRHLEKKSTTPEEKSSLNIANRVKPFLYFIWVCYNALK
jgi:hypothetical protein